MKTTVALISIVAALTAASPVLAQTPDAPAKADMKVDESMSMMDANADGMVSLEEHMAATKSMFTTADTNADGMVSADEMTAAATAKMTSLNMPVDPDKTNMMVQSKMLKLDTDKDGKVSWAEEETSATAMFKMGDTNADGMVSKDEMAAAMTHHMKMKK